MTRFEIIKSPPPGIVNVLFDLCVVYREGLTTSFTKIMTDEAVSTWRFDIHECIRKNSEKLLELICTKLQVTGFTIIFFFIYFLAGWINRVFQIILDCLWLYIRIFGTNQRKEKINFYNSSSRRQ